MVWDTSVPGDGRYLGASAVYTCRANYAVDGLWTQTMQSQCLLSNSEALWQYWDGPPSGISTDPARTLPACVREFLYLGESLAVFDSLLRISEIDVNEVCKKNDDHF